MLEGNKLLFKNDDYTSFSAYFIGKKIILGGKTLPAGQITTEILNIPDNTIMELFNASYDLMNMHNEVFDHDTLSTENYISQIKKILPALEKNLEMLDKIPVFKYLNLDRKIIVDWFSVSCEYCLLNVDKTDEKAKLRAVNNAVTNAKYFIINICTCYDELQIFLLYVTRFVDEYIERTNKKSFMDYAKALRDFFDDDELQEEIEEQLPDDRLANIFRVEQPVNIDYATVTNKENSGKYMIAERRVFRSLGGFLKADFYQALSYGHTPRKCHNCNRYFLLTEGYDTKYCNNVDPNDSKGRLCREVGAHNKQLRTGDFDYIRAYNRAYNRLKKRKYAGTINDNEWNELVCYAEDLRDQVAEHILSSEEAIKLLDEI